MSVEEPASSPPGLPRRALEAALVRQGELRHAVRVSVAVGGRLEPVPRENLSRRLAALLTTRETTPARNAA